MPWRASVLALLCLALAAVPATSQVLYDNGPINGTVDAWNINYGIIVSDTFTLSKNSTVTSFNFGVYEFPGDTMTSVDWSITSAENGGMVLGSGTASGANLTDEFVSTNQFGFNIHDVTVSGLNLGLSSNTYWLNLANASAPSRDPLYWDENSGVGCDGSGGGANCPSLASENEVGTIPSESFTVNGGSSSGGTTPEPGSLLLWASGGLGLAGVLRRKLL
jgi:hypothetical protein